MIQARKQSTLIVGIIDKPYDLLVNPGLTRREKEVLALISLSDKLIADVLSISYRTVVNTSVNIRRKTGCRSKGELIEYATTIKHQVVN